MECDLSVLPFVRDCPGLGLRKCTARVDVGALWRSQLIFQAAGCLSLEGDGRILESFTHIFSFLSFLRARSPFVS